MHPLDRYLLRRHRAPFVFALAILTSLMLINQILKQLPRLISKGVSPHVIVEVFVLSVPFIVAMTLPMAVLVAVLYVFARLPASPEVAVLQPVGVSALRLITPVFGAAACVAVLSLLWNDQLLPRTNHRLRILLVEIQRGNSLVPDTATMSDREMTIGEMRQAVKVFRKEASSAAISGQPTLADAATRRAAAYEVEIEKKYAIAAACLIFVLVGAPTALRIQGGAVWALCIVVFAFYYVGLIAGEDMGDALIVSPFLAMWIVNLVLGSLGLIALWSVRRRVYGVPVPPSA